MQIYPCYTRRSITPTGSTRFKPVCTLNKGTLIPLDARWPDTITAPAYGCCSTISLVISSRSLSEISVYGLAVGRPSALIWLCSVDLDTLRSFARSAQLDLFHLIASNQSRSIRYAGRCGSPSWGVGGLIQKTRGGSVLKLRSGVSISSTFWRSSTICASGKPNSGFKASKAAAIDSRRRIARSTAKGSAFGSDVATKIASSTIPAAVLRNTDGLPSDIKDVGDFSYPAKPSFSANLNRDFLLIIPTPHAKSI